MRLVKQLLYGIFYLALIAGIVVFARRSFLKPPTSCFDNIQNQNETGIDCGGVCGGVCLPANFEPLSVSGPVQILQVPGGQAVSLLAQVKNPNATLSAKTFHYAFSLRDASDIPPQLIEGTSFAYAGEFKYLLVPNISISSLSANALRADLSLDSPVWVPIEDFARPHVLLQNNTTNISEKDIHVTGVVLNEDAVPISSVTIIALLMNNHGVVGVSQTALEHLDAHESRAFTIAHPPVSIDPTLTRIFISALQ